MAPVATERFPNRLLWVLAFVVGTVFLFTGMFKVVGADWQVGSFAAWGLPPWLMYVVGVFETAAALLLMYKPAVFWVSIALALEMVAAIVVVILGGQSWLAVLALITIGVLAVLGWSRRPVRLDEWIAHYRGTHAATWA